jgi:cold-inducible RNA-binding protein
MAASRRMRNPNELFVGDLSFFCNEVHLHDLFAPFGTVVEARVKRSDKGGRTLMYGFVRMDTLKAALDSAKALNGIMLLGREIR